jgi:hypothetical protein
MRMGGGFGFGGRLRRGKAFSLSFSMGNAKVTLDQGTADQGKPYGNGKGYPATNAFVSGGGKFTHTASGAGMFWKCGFQGKQNAWVWKVRVLNRKDCCGDRLSGTKVSIGGQECGTISGSTKNGQWYEVKCAKPVRGNQIILETTRNVYLSISGIEVYSATCSGNGCGGTTQSSMMRSTSTSTSMPMPRMIKMGGAGKMVGGSTMRTVTSTSTSSSQPRMIKMGGMGKMIRMGGTSTAMPMPRMIKMGGTGKMITSTSTTRTMGGMMKMGGMGGMMRGMKRSPSPTFNMSGQKATLINPVQNPKYHKSSYGAENALKNNNSFTHTKNKKGSYWKASFKGGEKWVWKVRVQNRVDCCGGRLRGVKVMVGGETCGVINQPTQNGGWYEV